MTREEAEQYLYYAMTIGEQLLCCGAEVVILVVFQPRVGT